MKKSLRSRKFSLVTYLNESQLCGVLLQHSHQIRSYAYAYHDKDIAETGEFKILHCHVVLVLYNATSLSAVLRWFDYLTDEGGRNVNTLGEYCTDIYSQFDYLTHRHNPDKFQYSSDIVKSDDLKFWNAVEESSFDNLTLATFSYLDSNLPLRDLVKIYGRDFIIHYRTIKELSEDIRLEQAKFPRFYDDEKF